MSGRGGRERSEADRTDDRVFSQRMASIERDKHDLAEDYLRYYVNDARGQGMDAQAAFDKWSAQKWDDPTHPLTDAELGVLWYAIKNTPDGKVRFVPGERGRPDLWTGATEKGGAVRVPCEVEERMKSGGDLEPPNLRAARGNPPWPGSVGSYLETLAKACGWMGPAQGGPKSMPPLRPHQQAQAQAVEQEGWLPYKDSPDIDDEFLQE